MNEGHVGNYIDVHWSVGILFWVLILIGVVLFIKAMFGASKDKPGSEKKGP